MTAHAVLVKSRDAVLSAPADPWSVSIFAARESVTELTDTILSVFQSSSRPIHLEILVNGNSTLAQELCLQASTVNWPSSFRVRIWSVGLGDKSNAWNVAIHEAWAGETLAFFLDGYVHPLPGALDRLGEAVLENAAQLGGSGLPSASFTSSGLRDSMMRHGGFHGNLCCLTGGAVNRMRERGIRLPLGLYRGDGLLGAFLFLGFDVNGDWRASRVHLHQQECWSTAKKSYLSPSTWRGAWRRRKRQARGVLENLALRDWLTVERIDPSSWPSDIEDLVRDWAARHPEELKSAIRFSLLRRRAWDEISRFDGRRNPGGAKVVWMNDVHPVACFVGAPE